MIWLDALDLPLLVYLDGSYAVEAPLQTPRNRPDASEVEYRAAGLSPPRRRDKPLSHPYPMMRFPWARTEAALCTLAEHAGSDAVELDYINPETGQSCLPTMGFTAMLLKPGVTDRPPLRSASSVFHVVSGRGSSTVNGVRHSWAPKDTFSAPVFAAFEHTASSDEPEFLVRIHDTPLQEKLGYYEERAR